jgi:hypothetical protein
VVRAEVGDLTMGNQFVRLSGLVRLIGSLIAAAPERTYVGNHLIVVRMRHRNVWDT